MRPDFVRFGNRKSPGASRCSVRHRCNDLLGKNYFRFLVKDGEMVIFSLKKKVCCTISGNQLRGFIVIK